MYPNALFVALLVAIGCIGAVTVQQYHNQHEHGQHKSPPIPILKQHFEQGKEGYKFSYETGNGIHAEETGYIKNLGDKKHEVVVQKGSVTYHDEHGHPITLTYVADEHGFQPKGAHLPTPPPIPHEIQKSLQSHGSYSHHTSHPQHEVPDHQEVQAHQPVLAHHAVFAQQASLGHQQEEIQQQVTEEEYDQQQYGHY